MRYPIPTAVLVNEIKLRLLHNLYFSYRTVQTLSLRINNNIQMSQQFRRNYTCVLHITGIL